MKLNNDSVSGTTIPPTSRGPAGRSAARSRSRASTFNSSRRAVARPVAVRGRIRGPSNRKWCDLCWRLGSKSITRSPVCLFERGQFLVSTDGGILRPWRDASNSARHQRSIPRIGPFTGCFGFDRRQGMVQFRLRHELQVQHSQSDRGCRPVPRSWRADDQHHEAREVDLPELT